jgi:hypothetical protein
VDWAYNCCGRFFVWIWNALWKPIWSFISATWTACTQSNCSWWCLCCHKWLCWIVLIVLWVLSWVCGLHMPVQNRAALHSATVSVSSLTELEKLATIRSLAPGQHSVTLDIPGLEPAEADFWQATFNRYLSACGCKEGGLLAIISAITCVIYFSYDRGAVPSGWLRWPLCLATVCIVSTIGKVLGLLRAKFLLKKNIQKLKSDKFLLADLDRGRGGTFGRWTPAEGTGADQAGQLAVSVAITAAGPGRRASR